MVVKSNAVINLRMSSPINKFRFDFELGYCDLYLELSALFRLTVAGNLDARYSISEDKVQRTKYEVQLLRVLHSLHQLRQCVFGISIKHARHRLKKQRVLEA